MKIISVFIFISALLVFSCKKHTSPQVVDIDETNPNDYIYAEFYATLNIAFTPTSLPQSIGNQFVSVTANFYYSPNNELSTYPDLTSITYNSVPLSGFSNHSFSLPNNPFNPQSSALLDFTNINFEFSSKQLGYDNQVSETNSIVPTYTVSFTDTLYLNRNVTNTFTVNNTTNTTSNFVCKVENNFLSHVVPQGSNIITIYPSEIKNMSLGQTDDLGINFYRQKKIVSKGRPYYLYIEVSYNYPIKITG